MTRAEIVEKIRGKSALLEKHRSANPPASAEQIKALESEIRELQAALSANRPKRPNKPVYISGG